MFVERGCRLCLGLLLMVLPAAATVTLIADGQTDTYALINAALAPGHDAIEAADCLHPDFGPHITQAFDSVLGKYSFVFHLHAAIDGDSCERIDRQRNEIKTYGPSPDYVKGTLNHKSTYRWRFKLDSGFQPSPNFTHIHQLKAGDGSNAGSPIITLTPRAGSPDRLELIHVNDAGTSTKAAVADLADFKGEWVEAYETVTYSTHGQYSIELRRLRDGLVLLSFTSNDLDLWRTGSPPTTFVRPKWGIYRSLNTQSALRDEQVRFDRFCIAKDSDDCFAEQPPLPGSPPLITAVVDAAAYRADLPADSWISIYGANFAPVTRTWRLDEFAGGKLPVALDGVSVTIGNKPAPICFISPSLLTVQVPEGAAQDSPVVIQVNTPQGLASTAGIVRQFSPGLFTLAAGDGSYAAAQHAGDYSIAGKAGIYPGSTPARPGEMIIFYGSGFGPTAPVIPAGQLLTDAAVLANAVNFTIGGAQAAVGWAGLVAPGLYQFNVTVPESLAAGDGVVVAEISGVRSPANVLLTVQRP